MKKLFAMFALAALAACGGDVEEGAAVEDTTVVVPAIETAPVTTAPPMDTTMAPATTPVDTGAAATGTTMPADTPTTTTP